MRRAFSLALAVAVAAPTAHGQASLFTRAFVSLDGPLLCEVVNTSFAGCADGANSNVASIAGVARASASFGTLRGYASMRHTLFGGTLVTEVAEARAVARSTDQMTFGGGGGATMGLFYTSMDLTGTVIGPYADARLTVNGNTGEPTGPTQIQFGPFPFTVGVPLEVMIELRSSARAFNSQNSFSIADFENTARLLGVRFTDDAGAPLPGITITTASGTTVPNLTVTAAPEPATWSLVGAGALVLGAAARRRRRA
jgi:hypothetical protein